MCVVLPAATFIVPPNPGVKHTNAVFLNPAPSGWIRRVAKAVPRAPAMPSVARARAGLGTSPKTEGFSQSLLESGRWLLMIDTNDGD